MIVKMTRTGRPKGGATSLEEKTPSFEPNRPKLTGSWKKVKESLPGYEKSCEFVSRKSNDSVSGWLPSVPEEKLLSNQKPVKLIKVSIR